MARGSAEQNSEKRRADSYTPARTKSSVRPAWEVYEPPNRKTQYVPPLRRNEDDYHPATPLKTLTPAEIRAIVIVVIVVTAIALGIIFLAAQAAVAQKEINTLKRGIAQVDDDIANLKIEIEQNQNMQIIKNRAQAELGLKDPAFDQYVYVAELSEPQSDFGRYIKERAYGGARSPAAEPEPGPEPEPEPESE